MLAPYSEIARSKLSSGKRHRFGVAVDQRELEAVLALEPAGGRELRLASCRCRPAARPVGRARPRRMPVPQPSSIVSRPRGRRAGRGCPTRGCSRCPRSARVCGPVPLARGDVLRGRRIPVHPVASDVLGDVRCVGHGATHAGPLCIRRTLATSPGGSGLDSCVGRTERTHLALLSCAWRKESTASPAEMSLACA